MAFDDVRLATALRHAMILVLMLVFAQSIGLLGGLHAAARRAEVTQRAAFALQLAGVLSREPSRAFHDSFGTIVL